MSFFDYLKFGDAHVNPELLRLGVRARIEPLKDGGVAMRAYAKTSSRKFEEFYVYRAANGNGIAVEFGRTKLAGVAGQN